MERAEFDVMMEKLEELGEYMGTGELLQEIAQWFPVADMKECIEDIANTHDIELYDPTIERPVNDYGYFDRD